MSGIEILTTKIIEHPFWDVDTFIAIIFVLIEVISIIISIIFLIRNYFLPKFKHQPTKVYTNTVFSVIFFTFIGIAVVFASYITLRHYYEECQPETQYLVRISENASFLEFYNKYEILEDKGNDIFVVREIKKEGN